MWNEQEHEFFEDNFISITKTTSERIWKGVENPAETIGLYMFYADVAKWQKTNTVKATSGYVMKGTGWGRMKFRKIKQNLLDLKLIEDIVRISDEGEVIGHYVKVSYLFDKPLYKNAKKTEKKEKSVQINRGKKNENKKDSVLAVLENTKKGGVLISHTVENQQVVLLKSTGGTATFPHCGQNHTVEKQQTNTYNNNKMLIKNIKILSNASVGPEAPPSKLLKKKNEPKSKNPPEEIIKSLDLFIEVFPSQFNEASKRKPYAIPATRKIIDEVISIYGFEELKRIVEEYKKYSQNKFYAGISSNVYEFCKKIDKIKQSNEKARKEQRAISQPTKMSDNVKPSEIETRKMLGKLTHDLKTPLLDAITVDVIGKYKVKNRDFKFMRKLIYLLGIAEHKFISHYERIGEVEKEYTLFEIYWRAVDRWIEECIQDGQWFRNEDAEAELWDKSIFDL